MKEEILNSPGLVFKKLIGELTFKNNFEVSNALGIHPSTLGSIFSGRYRISVSMANKLSNFFYNYGFFDDKYRDPTYWIDLDIYYKNSLKRSYK